MKFNIKKILKYFSITLVSIILLLTIAIFSLQFPAVQNFVKNKLVDYLENKIHTKVQLDRVYIDFPKQFGHGKSFFARTRCGHAFIGQKV